MLKYCDSEKLPRVNWRGAVEIIQATYLPREVRAREDPTAAQSADAVNLRQTAGHYKLRAEMKRRTRRPMVNRIEINLVHQHERANAARDVANFAQNRIWRKRTRWIVQVRDHDKPRLWRNATKNLS